MFKRRKHTGRSVLVNWWESEWWNSWRNLCYKDTKGGFSKFQRRPKTYTTKQGSRVSCSAQTSFAAYDKGMQLISWLPYDETEQFSRLTSPSGIFATSPNLDIGGRGCTNTSEIGSQLLMGPTSSNVPLLRRHSMNVKG